MKNSSYISLSDVPLNKRCIISSLDCGKRLNKRLGDLGMGRGSVVVPVHTSPFGDISAFAAGGSVIAVRREDCKKIYVEPENF